MRLSKALAHLTLILGVFGYGVAVGYYKVFPLRQIQSGWQMARSTRDRVVALAHSSGLVKRPGESVAVASGLPSAFSPITTEALAAWPGSNWLTNGGNLFNQRYSSLNQINQATIGTLGAVWRTHLEGSGLGPQYSGEAQPLVHDGVIYIVTGNDDVFALSVETGRILWTYRSQLQYPNTAICCGSTSRGLGLGEHNVYLGQLDGKLVALDQRSGQVVWSVQAERSQDGFTITSAPLYYDGLVITGFAGSEQAIRGRIKAFNARTGALVWTFYTIPAPGEPGSDTWPATGDAWKFGGGAIWQTPAVDPALGLLYFQTANPNPDMNGGVRPGDNLFASSVVALEAATGKYRWHYQTIHHDIWDYDGANPVVLFDATIGGRTRHGLAAAGKTGWVYILDRTDGTPLVGIVERPVPQEPRQATSRTQPYPVGDAFVPQQIDIAPEGFHLVNQGRVFTPFWTDPVIFKPGTQGGANWPPSSYDPRTHTMFICATDQPEALVAQADVNTTPVAGETRVGGSFSPPMLSRGVFAAVDVTTNKLRWQQQWAEPCYSGSAATAGDVVFVGRSDGRFTALSSADGTSLWSFQADAGINAPPSVFQHAGKQFVVVYSSGNNLARSVRGDSVWLFALGGASTSALGRNDSATTDEADDDGPVDAGVGEGVYMKTCILCHGAQGQGGHSGIPLVAATDAREIRRVVTDGRNQMPSFRGALTSKEIQAVSEFVRTRLPH